LWKKKLGVEREIYFVDLSNDLNRRVKQNREKRRLEMEVNWGWHGEYPQRMDRGEVNERSRRK